MTDAEPDLPESAIDEAERLTRLARDATDPNEATAYRDRRTALLAKHGYTARVREDETRDVLVVHPEEWTVDGRIDVESIENTNRAVERPLSGPGHEAPWSEIEGENRSLARAVMREYGSPHGETAHDLADFASNHYAKPISDLTPDEIDEFQAEYFPRNAWPSDAQLTALETSLDVILAMAEENSDSEKGDRPTL